MGTDTSRRNRQAIGAAAMTVRPRVGLIVSVIATFIAVVAPVLLAFIYLALPTGVWVPVAVVIATAAAALTIMAVSYARIRLSVDDATVIERRFFGTLSRTDRDMITQIERKHIYRVHSLDTRTHLFLSDATGATVMHMHGAYWTVASMDAVSRELGIAENPSGCPETIAQLREAFPEMHALFDRRRIAAFFGGSLGASNRRTRSGSPSTDSTGTCSTGTCSTST